MMMLLPNLARSTAAHSRQLVRCNISTQHGAGRGALLWKTSFAPARDAVVRVIKVRAIVLRQQSSSASPSNKPSSWTNVELWGTMSAVAGWYISRSACSPHLKMFTRCDLIFLTLSIRRVRIRTSTVPYRTMSIAAIYDSMAQGPEVISLNMTDCLFVPLLSLGLRCETTEFIPCRLSLYQRLRAAQSNETLPRI
jgi:hypothetical protein